MTESKDLAPLRRKNLAAWMDQHKLTGTALAEQLGVGRAYVSAIFKPEKFFGEKAARSMELKLHMPLGYLDSDGHKPMAVDAWSSPSDLPAGVYALVPRIAVSLSAGNGTLVDEESNLPALAFREDWLRKQLVTQKKNLRVVSVSGDSMEPYLFNGDLALVDTGQAEVQDGQVYAISHSGELRIKRLIKKFNGGLAIRSDNAKYPEESLTPDEANSLKIIGRLLWRGG